MSAVQDIEVYTLAYTSPDSSGSITSFEVDSNYSFAFPIDGSTIVTLVGIQRLNSAVQGFLFVPTLPASDPCNKTAAAYVPKNVTNENDIPLSAGGVAVALIPWINDNCANSYINAATDISSTQALFVYLPQSIQLGNFPLANPPPYNSPSWFIDGNINWQGDVTVPTFGLNANDASVLMTQLGLYSGNITQAPNATYLEKAYSLQDSVRLFARVDQGTYNNLPSLWVFLLIVVGVLLSLVGGTSVLMHVLQRYRRRAIRRRILAGELDLETLGIKRLNVPPEILKTLRLVVYVAPEDSVHVKSETSRNASKRASKSGGKDEDGKVDAIVKAEGHDPSAASASTPGKSNDASSPRSSLEIAKTCPAGDEEQQQENLPPISSLPHEHLSFAQPSCSICLEDFISHNTIVRLLPCKHVFHPSCIDPVLLEYSSLCPICKASVLPAGYCPEITNTMVRRIRGLQRMRELDAMRHGLVNTSISGRAASISRQARGMLNPQARAERDVELRHVLRPGEGRRSSAAPMAPVAPANIPLPTSPTVQSPPPAPPVSSPVPNSIEPAPLPPYPTQPATTRTEDQLLSPTVATMPITQTRTSDGAQARPADMSREEWARRRAEGMLAAPVPADEAARRQEAARPAWRRVLGAIFPVVA